MLSSLLVSYYLHQVSPAPIVPDDVVVTGSGLGDLTIDIEESAGGSIAPGSQRVEMLTLTLSASCVAEVVVENIKLYRTGLGAREDIQSVYAMSNNIRVSDSRGVTNRDNSLDLRLKDLRVPACGRKEISFFADFSKNASPAGEHSLQLRTPLDVTSSARTRELGEINTAEPRRTVGQNTGTITYDSASRLGTLRYGARKSLARFRLTADSGSDHRITAITLTNMGSARDANIQNLYIVSGSKIVTGKVKQLTSNRVRLTFDPPFLLGRGDDHLFELIGDVRVGRSKTIGFTLEEPADIEAQAQRLRR